MPTSITSSGITFDDATTQTTSATKAGGIGTTQLANGSVTAAKLGTSEQRQIAKAWVNFDGTTANPSTIRSSYNVSSVTKNGTGDYTINFSTAMADANYSFTASGSRTNTGSNIITQNTSRSNTASALHVASLNASNGGFIDETNICVQIFGN